MSALLYVKDLIMAFVFFLRNSSIYRTFSFSGGSITILSFLEMLDMLKNIASRPSKLGFADWRPYNKKVYISKLRLQRLKSTPVGAPGRYCRGCKDLVQ